MGLGLELGLGLGLGFGLGLALGLGLELLEREPDRLAHVVIHGGAVLAVLDTWSEQVRK